MAKYYKQDSVKGYIEDAALIEAQKFNNVRHSVLGYMLGDFDDSGFYRVKPEIVSELISMPKYIVETMDNIEICQSTLKFDKQLSFMVVFEGNKATLSLIEKVSYESNHALNSGTWSNVNEYVLDEYETSGEVNRQMLYIKWNISTYPGAVIDIFSCDPELLEKYFNIVNRFKYNLKANAILLEKHKELEEIEAEYFLDIFEILKDYPELKDAVEKQIKVTLEEKKDFLKIDKPNFAKTLNEVLEKAIEDNIEVLQENEKENFEEQKHNVTVKANIKKYEVLDFDKTNVEENTILTIKTGEVRFEPLQELATEVATIQKQVEEEVIEKAVEVVQVINGDASKEETKKEKLTQVVEQIVKQEQAKVENLVSETTVKKIEEKRETAKAATTESAQAGNQQQAANTTAKKDANGASNKTAPKKGSAGKSSGKKIGPNKSTEGKDKQDKKPSLDGIKKLLKEIQDIEKLIKKSTLDIETSITYKVASEIFAKLEKELKKAEEKLEQMKKEGKSISEASKLIKTAEESLKASQEYKKRADYSLGNLKKKSAKSSGMIAGAVNGKTNSNNNNNAGGQRVTANFQNSGFVNSQAAAAQAGRTQAPRTSANSNAQVNGNFTGRNTTAPTAPVNTTALTP